MEIAIRDTFTIGNQVDRAITALFEVKYSLSNCPKSKENIQVDTKISDIIKSLVDLLDSTINIYL